MRRGTLVLAVLLAVAGCGERSRVDPDADITISGLARTPSGGPLADRPVTLASGVSGSDAALALLTVGLACTTGICSENVKETTTDASGAYQLTIKGRDTQSSFGTAEESLLTVSAGPTGDQVSGASVSASFKVQEERITLPALTLVDPRLSVAAAGSSVVASWRTTRPSPYLLTYEDATTTPVWRVRASGQRQAVDARVLEDSTGRVVLSGASKDRIEGSDLDITWRSPGVGYQAGLGPPPSRGRGCLYSGPGLAAVPAEGACPFTDGDLEESVDPALPCPSRNGTPAPRCAQPTRVTVDLGAVLPAELVVVRGCLDGCPVDVSSDGRRFRPVGSVSDGWGSVALPRQPVRFVRVGLGTDGLREVSVWGPTPRTPPLQEPDRDGLRGPFNPEQGDDRSWTLLIVVASVLVALGALAVGFALGRRRR